MAEYVITEDEYRAAMQKAYEAGKAGREIYTARDYLTRPLVRCRDCGNAHAPGMDNWLDCSHFAEWDYYDDEPGSCPVDPDGYCAWGERKGEPCR